MIEVEFIVYLCWMLLYFGVYGLVDDSVVIDIGLLVVIIDMLVEGVYFFFDDLFGDVVWKLVVINFFDLAVKGVLVEGVLFNYLLGDDGWDEVFFVGLLVVFICFDVWLIGGDMVFLCGFCVLMLIVLGCDVVVLVCSGVKFGDMFWVIGMIGDVRLGFVIVMGVDGFEGLCDVYCCF